MMSNLELCLGDVNREHKHMITVKVCFQRTLHLGRDTSNTRATVLMKFSSDFPLTQHPRTYGRLIGFRCMHCTKKLVYLYSLRMHWHKSTRCINKFIGTLKY